MKTKLLYLAAVACIVFASCGNDETPVEDVSDTTVVAPDNTMSPPADPPPVNSDMDTTMNNMSTDTGNTMR